MRIEVIKGDITKMHVDAIVNAANTSLLGGGGVDGAIHKAAGPELLEECRSLNGCPTGEARITGGYALPASHVIHTPGPIWRGGAFNEAMLLADSYRNCMQLASDKGLRSIAFPNISTGVYGFPKRYAAEIAVKEVRNFLKTDQSIIKVMFVCFDNSNFHHYKELLRSEGT